MAWHRFCDGVSRRDFLGVGLISGLGLTLDGYLRLAAAGELHGGKARAAIFINLAGGPSHLDTFDLKPEAPAEYRGEFKPIATNVPGMAICEHLPKLARCGDRYALLRGVTHSIADHNLGSQYMNSGNRPTPGMEYPGYGPVVSRELGALADLPSFVAIPNTPQKASFLGIRHAPFQTNAVPSMGKPFSVRGITIGPGLTIAAVERRERLLTDVDAAFRGFETSSDLLEGLDQFKKQGYGIITSPRARKAFDISQEPAGVAERFGNHGFGQSCLLACRLIEAGVRFVNVSFGNWDTHVQNFKALAGTAGPKMQPGLLPRLDDGLSALLELLHERGLLDTTSVMVTGEFGRTPKINKTAGRDHWARSMCVLMAGGGVRGGQVLGASDAKGEMAKGDGIKPEDIAASFYQSLGIDHTKEYHTDTGRPIMIVRDGKPIKQLFA
jgi:hypothetical protein